MYIKILSIMINIFIIIFILTIISCASIRSDKYSDSPYPVVEIKEYGVKGVVFPDTVEFMIFKVPSVLTKRFTPDIEDIIKFEEIFHKNLEEFIRTRPYYRPDLEIKGKTYRNYFRQYIGFMDKDKNRYILTTFFRTEFRDLYEAPVFEFHSSWNIYANLEKGELFEGSDLE